MEKYKPIGICAGALMIPWKLLSEHVKVEKNQEVDVYINIEGMLRNLTLENRLTEIVSFYKSNVVIDMESSIINMVANYRSYFIREGAVPNIYLYYTSLGDHKQQMEVSNKYYRSYYRNKYTQNPNFRSMGELVNKVIIPETKLILSYVPKCYLVESKTFDGSIIPLIITNETKRRGIIISTDVFDTLYQYNPEITMIYVKRRYSNLKVYSDIDSIIQSIVKDVNPFDLTIFRSELYYRLLLAIKGSKIRNITSAKGFGYGKFLKLIQDGIEKDLVLKDLESIDSVIQLFPGVVS